MSTYDDIQSLPPVLICSALGPPPPLCLSVRSNAFVSTAFYRSDEPEQRWQIDRIDGNGNIAIWMCGQRRVLTASQSDGSLGLRYKDDDGTLTYATDEIWNVVEPDFSAAAKEALKLGIIGALVPLIFATQSPGVQLQVPFAVRPNFDYNRNLNILGNGPYETGSAVAAWHGWGGGEPNEVWVFVTPDMLTG